MDRIASHRRSCHGVTGPSWARSAAGDNPECTTAATDHRRRSPISVGGEPADRDHNDHEEDDRNHDPEHTNAVAVSMWSTIQPKFIPKNPVIKVRGRKITVTRVSRSLIVAERRDSVSPSIA